MIKLKNLLFERSKKDSKDSGGVLYYYGENQVLLCLGSNSGTWNIPKGHIQIGEEPLDGSVREFTEETQIVLNGIPELVNVYKKEKGGKFYLYVLQGEKRFIPHLNHEHIDWGYFEISNLPEPIDDWVNKTIEKLRD
jgi:ADP-ribose pyrophosphatase YjhB (NUDIX family)|tara:strand:+ start:506 stop:916 length:411 start_codon:yes stop_codon:yes gene_type:complete